MWRIRPCCRLSEFVHYTFKFEISRSAVHSHLISIWLLLPFRMRCVSFIKCREWLCRPFDCNCLRFFTPKMFPIRKSISNWIFKLVGIMLLHNTSIERERAQTHTHTQRTTAWKHRKQTTAKLKSNKCITGAGAVVGADAMTHWYLFSVFVLYSHIHIFRVQPSLLLSEIRIWPHFLIHPDAMRSDAYESYRTIFMPWCNAFSLLQSDFPMCHIFTTSNEPNTWKWCVLALWRYAFQ